MGYEPNELPDCSTPQRYGSVGSAKRQIFRAFKEGCYDDTLMANVSRARGWIALTFLALLAGACDSKSADPNALPSWIAVYPGSPTPERAGSAFVFQTKDEPEKILDFYERQLDQNGVHKEARGGGEYGGFLAAGDDAHNRNVMIDVRPDKGTSEVSITVVAKK